MFSFYKTESGDKNKTEDKKKVWLLSIYYRQLLCYGFIMYLISIAISQFNQGF